MLVSERNGRLCLDKYLNKEPRWTGRSVYCCLLLYVVYCVLLYVPLSDVYNAMEINFPLGTIKSTINQEQVHI